MISLGLFDLPSDYEKRDGDTSTLSEVKFWLKDALGLVPTHAGVSVTPDSALGFEAVYSCIRVISETIASLPLKVYRLRDFEEGGRDVAREHPLYSILHDLANPEQTAMEVRELLAAHLLLRGNAYAEIVRDQANRVIGLFPLRPDKMKVDRVNRQLLYTYTLPDGQPIALRGASDPRQLPQVLHIRGLSPDGIVGYSPVHLMRQTIGLGMAMEEYGAKLFKNGARPGGLLKTDKTLTKGAQERLKESWEKLHQGLEHAHRIAVLEEGLTWQQVGMAPEDAQFIQSKKLNRNQICGIFRVPPHMIADLERATFSNIEHQAISFHTHTIRPWLVRIEQALKRDLLGPVDFERLIIEHSIEGLLRGDIKTRYEAFQIGVNNGWLSPDEIREMENRNPIPDGKGKGFREPLNMKPLGEPAPVPGEPAEPADDLEDEAA